MYFLCIYDPLLLLQSDESDESSEESATDNREKCLSDGKKKYIFVLQGNAKSEIAHTITSSK